MKNIIEMVLKEEDAARTRIEQARQDAEVAIARADKEAQDIVSRTAAELKEAVRVKREETQAEFLSEKETDLKAASEEYAGLRKKRERDIIPVARKTFLQIIHIGE